MEQSAQSHNISPSPQVWHAIVRMVAAMAAFAMMNICIRYVSHEMPTPQIVFLRNVFAVVWLVPWVMFYGVRALHTQRISRHIWRAGVGIVSMELWFYALALMPITDATALSFTSPLWATLLAVIFLGERIGIHRILALCVGFVGALVIIRPSSEMTFGIPVLVVLSSAVLMAVSSILVKSLTGSDPAWRIVFFMSLFMAIFSAPLGIWFWKPLTGAHVVMIIAVAGFGVVAHLLMVSAFSRASLVILIPFDFMRLIFTAILAHVFFQETLGIWTAVGSVVIIVSTCYISWREQKKKRT